MQNLLTGIIITPQIALQRKCLEYFDDTALVLTKLQIPREIQV